MKTIKKIAVLFVVMMFITHHTLCQDSASSGQGKDEPTSNVDTSSKEEDATASDTDSSPKEEDGTSASKEKKKDNKIFEWDFHWDWEKGLLYQYKQVIVLPFGVSMPHRFEDIRLKGKVGMKLMLDGAVYRETGDMPIIDNGVELRRALVKTSGNFYWGTPVDYLVEFQYVTDSGFSFKEASLRFKEIPTVGSIWVGQMDMPQGLEVLMSSKDLTFMEVASPLEALAPGTKFGVKVGDPFLEGRGTLNAGLFTDSNNFEYGDATNALARLGTRVTFLPYISGENKKLDLVHLGLSSSLVYSPDAEVRYRSRPESHLAPDLVDTGNIEGEFSWVSGLEGAAVWGPLHVQSELMYSFVKMNDGDPLNFWGAYAHVGWFPTGEVMSYNKDGGYFGHLIPNQPIQFPTGSNQGAGALELAARLSYIDLNDEFIEGGRMGILMTGVTWYLSSNVRWMLNIGAAEVDHTDRDGGLFILQTRIQWTY